MKNICIRLAVIVIAVFTIDSKVSAQVADSSAMPFECCRPDGHAPLGVLADHIHAKGEWTLSYTYMNMMMHGNRIGVSKVDDNQLYQTYMMSPDKMTMQMHMFMVMYSLTDKLTFMGMLNYSVFSMSMNVIPLSMMMNMPGMNNANMPTSSKTNGIGDTQLFALYKLMEKNRQRFILSMGLSLPTGSITKNGTTMLGDNQRLAYPMQLGTGTFNLLPALTYVCQKDLFSFGTAASANIKMGTNSQGYTWGNEYKLTGWIAYKCSRWLSTSIRVEGVSVGKMTGYDPLIYPLSVNDPSANSNNYGGQRANLYFGLNLFKEKCSLKGNRLLLEYGIPVYQNLNGPQMSMQSNLSAGWQYTF